MARHEVGGEPLVGGVASLVIHTDGTVAVGQWGRDLNLAPDVVAVRQNLVLLVDGRAATAAANRPYPAWGVTPDGSSKVWRSAVGVDGGGNICVPDATPGFPLHCIPPAP